MKLHCLILFILLAVNASGFAQESSITAENENTADYLIIALEPHMYLANWDAELGKANNKNYQEINDYFRLELDRAIYKVLTDNKSKGISLLLSSDPLKEKDLNLLYKITSQTFEKVVSKTENKKNERSNGKEVLLAKATIDNDSFFAKICSRYHAQTILLINQLEVKRNITDQYQLADNNYNNLLIVHFSIANSNGKIILNSYAETEIEANETNLKTISQTAIFKLAQEIVSQMTKN